MNCNVTHFHFSQTRDTFNIPGLNGHHPTQQHRYYVCAVIVSYTALLSVRRRSKSSTGRWQQMHRRRYFGSKILAAYEQQLSAVSLSRNDKIHHYLFIFCTLTNKKILHILWKICRNFLFLSNNTNFYHLISNKTKSLHSNYGSSIRLDYRQNHFATVKRE